MKMRCLALAFALIVWGAAVVHAACPTVPTINLGADGYGGGCVTLGTTTYQGTLNVPAATSTALVAGINVVMASSTVLPAPGAFVRLSIINVGSNAVYVCWFGGAASASSGCELLAAGAGDTKNIAGAAAAPTFFSPSGATLSFSN